MAESYLSSLVVLGLFSRENARERTRTFTELPPRDFKSLVSTIPPPEQKGDQNYSLLPFRVNENPTLKAPPP